MPNQMLSSCLALNKCNFTNLDNRKNICHPIKQNKSNRIKSTTNRIEGRICVKIKIIIKTFQPVESPSQRGKGQLKLKLLLARQAKKCQPTKYTLKNKYPNKHLD